MFGIIKIENEEKKMQQQKWKIPKKEIFDLTPTFECGQCFRWERETSHSYIGVFKQNVIRVKQEQDSISFEGICEGTIQDVCTKYFDLETDYEGMQQKLKQVDENMKKSITYGKGIHILNQDLWETILSFIISANNNIPRIKGIIERLSKAYGEEIWWEGKAYYTFPTPKQLSKANVEDFRKLGLGFRDKRVYETTQRIVQGNIVLDELRKETDFSKLRETLLTFPGVGPKVADCILLFSDLKRWEAFPIDVWVKRVMNELYLQQNDEKKVKNRQIEQIAYEKFGELAGLAQQYLFYWRRDEERNRKIS